MNIDQKVEQKLTIIIVILILIVFLGLIVFQIFYFNKKNSFQDVSQQMISSNENVLVDTQSKSTNVKISNFKEEFEKIKKELLDNDNFQKLNQLDVNWPPQDIEKVERDDPFDPNQSKSTINENNKKNQEESKSLENEMQDNIEIPESELIIIEPPIIEPPEIIN